LLESLGYSLAEALRWPGGVGAHVFVNASQAMHPILVEVDIEPFERLVSPPWQPLSPPTWRRRVGLWCALHGESLLEGGVCRLAAHYAIDALRLRLQRATVGPLGLVQVESGLAQFCAAGSRRPVNPSKVDLLEKEGFLSEEGAERIRLGGLVAAHLQCIERETATAARYVSPAICDDLSESVPFDQVWRSKAPRRLRRRMRSRRPSR
jgi:hypothetical protein